MTKTIATIFVFLSACFITEFVFGQDAGKGNDTTGYVRGRNILFEDKLVKDAVNSFPKKWEDSHYFKTVAFVKDKLQCCSVQSSKGIKDIDIPYETGLIPRLSTFAALGDSFTVDYDVFSFKGSIYRLSFYDATTERNGRYDYFMIGITDSGYAEYNSWFNDVYGSVNKQYPGVYNFNKWHHVSFSYNNGALRYYLDHVLLVSIDSCKSIQPKTGAMLFYNKEHVLYANVQISTNAVYSKFNKILTGTKFVTHDINFGVNQSVMDKKSIAFVTELGEWLRQNPKVNLEINGHTDNDGADAANLTLSKARAEAVKELLVKTGVEASRLTTHGFGSEMPLEPNGTASGRAVNRRVELIKK